MKLKTFPPNKTKKTRAFVCLMLSFLLAGTLLAQGQNQPVSFSKKTQTIAAALKQIEEQTSLTVAYNESLLDVSKTIQADVAKMPLKEALKLILQDSGASYKIEGNQIILVKASPDPPAKRNLVLSGTVVDANTGITIPGATVMVKNSFLGTVTNNNGAFRLMLPEVKDYVVNFSFIGYKAQEVKVSEAKTQFTIQLEPHVQQVSEVVATGYQVIDKRILTSAVSSIKADELDMKNALTVDQMLEGKATGLEITNLSATPGAAAKVRVRSSNTFTGNQSPLWVIDGVIYEDPVPLSNDDINSFDNINLIGNALTGINPQDIESIDVLKDASATAIYGVKAANGVISVTTKRGDEGAPKLTYSFSGSFVQTPSYDDFNLMNSKERIDVSREMYARNLGYSSGGFYENADRLGYEGALMNYWDGKYDFQEFRKQVSYLETLNTDWFDELYRPAFNQAHAVNVSGGNKTTRYYTSVGYDKQDGTETGVSLDRITARANVDFDLRSNVRLAIKFNGSVQKAAYNHSSINTFDEAYYNARTTPAYNDDGSYFYQQREIWSSSTYDGAHYARYNIMNEIDQSAKNITNKDFGIQAQLNWDNFLIDDLKLSSRVSYRNTTNMQEEWIDANTYYVAKLRTYDAVEDYIQEYANNKATVPVGGLYSGGMVDQTAYAMTNQLNYRKVLNRKHVLNANFSQEIRSTHYWGATGFTAPGYSHNNGRNFIYLPQAKLSQATKEFDFDSYVYDNMINWFAGDIYPSITDRLNNSMSFFGILSYVYDNRYIANFNMRSDGTNAFGQYKEYRFKPTWSVSGRWNIHNERFLADKKNIDELAFRASFGVRGTIPSSTPYLTIMDYGPESSSNSYFSFDENVAKLNSFPQTNLRWELNKTTNLGISYSFYQGRISGSFDYAYSFSDDLILVRPASLANGSASQSYNGGSKDVQSYEFSIRTVNVKSKDFSWSTNFNLSRDVDRVLKGYELNSGSSINVSKYLNGSIYSKSFPSSGFYSYKFDGLNEEGLPQFANVNRPELMPDEQLKAMLQYEGQRNPQLYGGFGTALRYKRFTLSASFSYKLGYKLRLLALYNGQQNLPRPYENMSAEFNNRWKKAGDEAHTNIPSLSNDELSISQNATNYTNGIFPSEGGGSLWELYDLSTTRTVRGDHIRWNSLSFSYNMPSKLVNKMGLSNLTVGASGSNLGVWAFDKDLKGQDPNQVRSIGLPSLPTFSFNLNVSL